MFDAFEKANNVKVVVVPGTPSDIRAKAQANNDNPQMHVMLSDDCIMYRATCILDGPGRSKIQSQGGIPVAVLIDSDCTALCFLIASRAALRTRRNPASRHGLPPSALITQMNDYMKTAIAVNWEAINENRPAWNARWNKSVERGPASGAGDGSAPEKRALFRPAHVC